MPSRGVREAFPPSYMACNATVLLTLCFLPTEIEDLSWVQKKRLDEVRKIMEQKHGFKAS